MFIKFHVISKLTSNFLLVCLEKSRDTAPGRHTVWSFNVRGRHICLAEYLSNSFHSRSRSRDHDLLWNINLNNGNCAGFFCLSVVFWKILFYAQLQALCSTTVWIRTCPTRCCLMASPRTATRALYTSLYTMSWKVEQFIANKSR